MSNKKSSSIKKEIFLPSIIGDWTTYTSEKNKESISITKSIGLSNKTISEQNLNQLLFFHQEFFELFFDKITHEINSHIELESISINILNHHLFKQNLKGDIYQCKFKIPELEQIDLIFSKKATKYIAHRLCGGNHQPEEMSDPTDVEVSLVSFVNNIFFEALSLQWKKIFPFIPDTHTTSFGHYQFQPQQAENETIIELNANFKLFKQHDLSCKIIYSLETIEKLLFFEELLNSNIVENTYLTKETLKTTTIDIRSIIGRTSLALNEIQNIEIGDVILLENKKLTDSIELIVDNNITFNVHPIKINDRELGVQIISSPQYENFAKEGAKPIEGPFLSSGKKPEESPPQNPMEDTLKKPKTNTPVENHDDLMETAIAEANPLDTQEIEAAPEETNEINEGTNTLDEEPPEIDEKTEDSKPSDTVANEDFSWDDLDDE